MYANENPLEREALYSEYKLRLDAEYTHYQKKLMNLLPCDLYCRYEEILALEKAYEFLMSLSSDDPVLDYVMEAMYPLHEIVGRHPELEERLAPINPVGASIYEIHERHLFDSGETIKYTGRIPIRFHRELDGLEDIMEAARNFPDDKFVIEQIIELRPVAFLQFSETLSSRRKFISKHIDVMGMDIEQRRHCILVHDAQNKRGVLVDSEGRHSAYWTAFVQDTGELDLQNIPVEQYAAQISTHRKPEKKER